MSLELYFAELISTSGALELVLESDNAPATKKRMLNSTCQLNAGPPNFPLRQVSRDDLYTMPSLSSHKRSLRQRPQQQKLSSENQQHDGLKDFYDKVAPGLRPHSKKFLAPYSSRHNVNPLLAPGMMSKMFQLPDMRPLSRSISDEPQKSIYEYLDKVQEVVMGNNYNKDDSALV
jgi:hypothetical protein